MKNLFAVIGALLIISLTTLAQEAQKSPKPGFFVFSQNKVSDVNMAKVNSFTDSLGAPILDELVKEGKLLGWGVLTHAWGDEWNYNIYYVTENHAAFLSFWSEYISRLNKRFPGWIEKTRGLLVEHKDNMYSIRTMR